MIESLITHASDAIAAWSAFINEATHGNEFLAGILGGGAITWVGYAARSIPAKVVAKIKHMTTTTLTLNNAGFEQQENYNRFLAWAEEHTVKWLSRSKSVNPSRTYDRDLSRFVEHVTVSLGYGNHIAFWGGRPVWIRMDKLDSSGSERQKEEITVTMLGRRHAIFTELFDSITPKDDGNDKISVYKMDMHGDWERSKRITRRPLESVAMPVSMREEITSCIDHFKNQRGWYYENSLAYKLAFILHGQPGTGKTSLIRALASHYNMNLCTVSLATLSDKTFEAALDSVPTNSVVVIEDFDSSKAFHDRNAGGGEEINGGGGDSMMNFSPLTISGVLNVLDGVVPLDNCILFFTTNHLEMIDPAVTRKGRIDRIVEVGDLSGEDIRRYSERVFPEFDFSSTEFIGGRGCFLNEALLYGKDDASLYLESLKSNDIIK